MELSNSCMSCPDRYSTSETNNCSTNGPDGYTSWCSVDDIESNLRRNQAIFERSLGIETKQKLERAVRQVQCFTEELETAIRKRRSTLVTLRDVAIELDSMKSDVDIAKVTGSSAAVFGGSMAIAGAIASVFTFGLATPLVVAGVTTAMAGGVTAGGAEIAEAVISKDNMKKAQDVLDEDKQALTKVDDSYAKLKSLVEDVSKSSPHLGSSDEILCSLLVANKSKGTVGATKLGFTASVSAFAVTCVILATFAKTATKQAGKTVGKVGPKVISRLLPRLASVVAKGAVETAGAVALTTFRGALKMAAPVVLAFDIYELVKTSISINNGSKSAAADKIREILRGFEKQLEEMGNLLSEPSSLSGNLDEMLREEFKNLLENIASEDEVSDEQVHAALKQMMIIASEEWRNAFVRYVTNRKAYVSALACIFCKLKQKIEEYEEEEEEKKDGIINLTFLAHGEVRRPLLPCSLYYLSDRVQPIVLYEPWGCLLHNSAAYGITTGNISTNRVRYTTDHVLPNHPSNWNTLPSDSTMIPEAIFTQVNTTEYVYKLLMNLFYLFRGRRRGLFIPYFNPPGVPSLPEVPLWALTNVVAMVGWILGKRFRIHIAACLFPSDESILTREDYPLLPFPTVNCRQYCVVPVNPEHPVTMYIPGFIVPEEYQPAFGVLDTLLGMGREFNKK